MELLWASKDDYWEYKMELKKVHQKEFQLELLWASKDGYWEYKMEYLKAMMKEFLMVHLLVVHLADHLADLKVVQ